MGAVLGDMLGGMLGVLFGDMLGVVFAICWRYVGDVSALIKRYLLRVSKSRNF